MSFVCVNLYNAIHMFFCVFVSASACFVKINKLQKKIIGRTIQKEEKKKTHNITQKIKKMSNTDPTYNLGFTKVLPDINETLNGHYVSRY
jgi:hypothetical protein